MQSAPSPADTHLVLHADLRALRAIRLAGTAAQWMRLPGGAYRIPSERQANTLYTTSVDRCTCPDADRGSTCKHRLAVALYTTLLQLLEGLE